MRIAYAICYAFDNRKYLHVFYYYCKFKMLRKVFLTSFHVDFAWYDMTDVA